VTITVNSKSMEDTILDHLIDVGSITGLEAQGLYKCRHLPRRIKTLRERGFSIISHRNKDHTGQRYVRYQYVGYGAPA
jgi:hypothetical protein